jgi:DNA-binding beta-propeller fold protein YncE
MLFVTDPVAGCVHVFNPVDETYEQIREAATGWLEGPVGVTCDSRNHLYVSDADAGRVTVYDDSFTPLFDISDGLIRPTGLAVFRDALYVVDSGAHVIRVYDTEGRLLDIIGRRGSAPGEFNFPLFLTAAGGLMVVDALNFRIQSFDADMHVVSVFGSAGDRPGTFARPKGIGVDSDGNVYVSDALFDAVQVFDSSGTLLLVFGQTGSGEGGFQSPNGMYIDVSDRIHVCDALNGRVQIFEYLKGGTE